jgi:hypothetical protein
MPPRLSSTSSDIISPYLTSETPGPSSEFTSLPLPFPKIYPSTSAAISLTLEKIQKYLPLIETRVIAPQSIAKPSLSYADAARMPPHPPQAPTKKLVPSRHLREVTVQTIWDPKPL